MQDTKLFVYKMPGRAVTPLHDAGMHIAREIVTPLCVEPVGDLMARLRDANVELRITPSLWPLWNAVITLVAALFRPPSAQRPTRPTQSETTTNR
jgi:hypothetical protein